MQLNTSPHFPKIPTPKSDINTLQRQNFTFTIFWIIYAISRVYSLVTQHNQLSILHFGNKTTVIPASKIITMF